MERKTVTVGSTSFLCGVIFKEVVSFIRGGGLTSDYPLSRSLFFIILALVMLGLMEVRRLNRLEQTTGSLSDEVEKIKKNENN
jgi:hypothetical protein